MVNFKHLCSCDEEIENILRNKALSPSQCLRIGVLKMANLDIPLAFNEKIEKESVFAQKERQRMALQNTIFELEEELNKYKEEKCSLKRK